MTPTTNCTIKLLNKSYGIKCPENEETNLLLVATQLNEKMTTHKNNFKKLDEFQALLLAALEIGRELILCKNEQELQRNQVTQFITSLESKINKTMSSDIYNIPQAD